MRLVRCKLVVEAYTPARLAYKLGLYKLAACMAADMQQAVDKRAADTKAVDKRAADTKAVDMLAAGNLAV